MIHRGADFDAGGKAVDEDAAGDALEGGEERLRGGEVGGVAVDSRGELAFERGGAGGELVGGVGDHDEREGAEGFRGEHGMCEEIFCGGGGDAGLGLGAGGAGGGGAGGEDLHAGSRGDCGAVLEEGLADAAGEHRAAGGGREQSRERVLKRVGIGSAGDEDEAGLGAELADAHGERREETLGNRGAAFGEGAG